MPDIVSDWLVPLSEPRRDRIVYRLSVAGVVSGVLTPVLNPNTQITQFFESRWHQPWSEPRRDKVVRHWAIARAASGFFNPSYKNPDASNQIRGWFQEFRGPVWPKKGLRIQLQQFFTAPERYLPPAIVTVDVDAHETQAVFFGFQQGAFQFNAFQIRRGYASTDTANIGVWVHEDLTPIDRTGVFVSITEGTAGSTVIEDGFQEDAFQDDAFQVTETAFDSDAVRVSVAEDNS